MFFNAAASLFSKMILDALGSLIAKDKAIFSRCTRPVSFILRELTVSGGDSSIALLEDGS